MEDIYVKNGIRIRQAETEHKILKHLNQDIRESGNITCRLAIVKFTSYHKILQNDTNCGTQNWNCNGKGGYEDYEIKREETEKLN
jgi:hypothetical protein